MLIPLKRVVQGHLMRRTVSQAQIQATLCAPSSTRLSVMARKALCIGINDYPGTQMDLKGCVNDANDWAAALIGRSFNVSRLLDSHATRVAIMGMIRGLISTAAKNDSLVITFSGCGTWVPDSDGDEADGRDEALCPYDVGAKGVIVDDEIKTLFATRKTGVRLLMVTDSCHSGTVTRAASNEAGADTRERFMPMGNWMSAKAVPRKLAGTLSASVLRPTGASRPQGLFSRVMGDVLLAGCEEGQYCSEGIINGRPNGAFTYYALKALKTLKPDATYADWHQAILKYLPSDRYPQSPQLFASDTDRKRIVFA